MNLKGDEEKERKFLKKLQKNSDMVATAVKMKDGKVVILSDGEESLESQIEMLELFEKAVDKISDKLEGELQ